MVYFFLKYMYLFYFFLSGNTFHTNRLREIVPTNKYKIRSQQGQVPTACNSAQWYIIIQFVIITSLFNSTILALKYATPLRLGYVCLRPLSIIV
jgi:hypothetical protein